MLLVKEKKRKRKIYAPRGAAISFILIGIIVIVEKYMIYFDCNIIINNGRKRKEKEKKEEHHMMVQYDLLYVKIIFLVRKLLFKGYGSHEPNIYHMELKLFIIDRKRIEV